MNTNVARLRHALYTNRVVRALDSLVGNERGFIHKKLLGIGKGLVGAIPGIGTAVSTATSLISAITAKGQQKQVGLVAKFPELGSSIVGRPVAVLPRRIVGNGGIRGVHAQDEGPCLPPLIRGPEGRCIAPTSPLGARVLVGEATMGRYGAALIPGSQIVDRATCLRGMQLGNDGLCYNRGQITNKQRMWPAGRKPLLTGGQMNAISIAARAAKRLEVTTKRLQRMGMMKKPAARRALPRGHVARLEHASEH